MSKLTLEQFDELKVKFKLSIGFAGECQEDESYLHEHINYEDWVGMNEDEKSEFLYESSSDWAGNYIDLAGYLI